MARKNFPNGFTSWMETFFEVTSYIEIERSKDVITSKVISEIQETEGTCGMYSLAEKLTDKFEKENKGRFWDGEYWDEIEKFLVAELS